jgi:hypothetical protein
MKSISLPLMIGLALLVLTSGCGSGRTAEQEQIATHVAQLLSQTETPTVEIIPQVFTPVAATPEPTMQPEPAYEMVKLAWFYGLPTDKMDPKLLANNINLFVSSLGLEDERDQLRALGSKAPFFQYVLFSEIEKPGSCNTLPFPDQVADKPGDFCRIEKSNPEWFLTTNNGDRIHTEPPYETYWLLDPGNQDWRAFWLSRMQERESLGWDGVFLDNLEARPRNDEIVLDQKRYPDEASYQEATIGFLQTIYQYFHGKNIPVFANIIAVENVLDWTQFLPYLDGGMMEDFAVDWDTGYHSVEYWETQMEIARTAQSMGKEIILVSQGNQKDLARQNFAFASYLLVQNGMAFFRYTHTGSYSKAWFYDNYSLKPGRPLGEMYKFGDTWQRDFENGYVKVNPSSHTAEINISK